MRNRREIQHRHLKVSQVWSSGWPMGPSRQKVRKTIKKAFFLITSMQKWIISAIYMNTKLLHNESIHGLNSLISFFSKNVSHIITPSISIRFSECKTFRKWNTKWVHGCTCQTSLLPLLMRLNPALVQSWISCAHSTQLKNLEMGAHATKKPTGKSWVLKNLLIPNKNNVAGWRKKALVHK